MAEDDVPDGEWVGLQEALESLRADLTKAWWSSAARRVRFRMEAVELTAQVGVTRAGRGSAGVKWHVLTLGGERSKEVAATQTLKLQLTPVLFDDQGKPLPEGEQFVSDHDDERVVADELRHEPE